MILTSFQIILAIIITSMTIIAFSIAGASVFFVKRRNLKQAKLLEITDYITEDDITDKYFPKRNTAPGNSTLRNEGISFFDFIEESSNTHDKI